MGRILLTLLAAIFVIAAAYIFNVVSFRTAIDARLALNGARIVEGPLETRSVFEYGLWNRRAVTLPTEQRFVDYVKSGAAELVLTFDETTREMSLTLIAPTTRTLVSDITVKSAPSISPQGDMVAYAAWNASTTDGTVPSDRSAYYNPDNWIIRIIDVATGSVSDAGQGYAPKLFHRDGTNYLLFTAADGTHIRPLMLDAQDLIIPEGGLGDWPAEVSADGTYIAIYDGVEKMYHLSRITTLGPVVEKKEVRSAPVTEVAFTEKGVFFVSPHITSAQSLTASLQFASLASATEQPITLETTPTLLQAFRILP
jgi:hypothetical protein